MEERSQLSKFASVLVIHCIPESVIFFKLFLALEICISNIYFVLCHADGDRSAKIGFAILAAAMVIIIIVAVVIIFKLRRWVYVPFSLHTNRKHDTKLNPMKIT